MCQFQPACSDGLPVASGLPQQSSLNPLGWRHNEPLSMDQACLYSRHQGSVGAPAPAWHCHNRKQDAAELKAVLSCAQDTTEQKKEGVDLSECKPVLGCHICRGLASPKTDAYCTNGSCRPDMSASLGKQMCWRAMLC